MLGRWLRLVVGLLLVSTVALNVYIRTYPVLHECDWSSGAGIKLLAFGDPQITGAGPNTPLRKRIDIKGNDMFLRHTAKTLKMHLEPDVVAVMGDLISSQWIDDLEFYRRADRFKAIFGDLAPLVFNVSGNHDIGYHGEMTDFRMERFRARYGKVNFVHEFGSESSKPWRIVVINSLSLDGPPADDVYATDTREFLATLAAQRYDGETVLLTHVPLYKPVGICRDGPMFKYYDNGNLREQNHLSREASQLVLASVFGSRASGIILAGHDHHGCAASYLRTQHDGQDDFEVTGGVDTSESGAIPEITVKSVMGEYGGNGGLVSGVWNAESAQWQFQFSLCPFQVQHIWWVTTILTYVSVFTSGILAAVYYWA